MTILSFGLSYQNKGCSECLKDDYITIFNSRQDSRQQPAACRQWTVDSRQKTTLSFEPSYQNKSGSEYVQDDYYMILGG